MGSGVLPLAMATRLSRDQKRVVRVVMRVLAEACSAVLRRGLPRRYDRIVKMILAAGCGRFKRYRAISTGQLRGLPRFHLRPIDVVVYHGSRRDLVLRRVSRLDAFSGYPVRT